MGIKWCTIRMLKWRLSASERAGHNSVTVVAYVCASYTHPSPYVYSSVRACLSATMLLNFWHTVPCRFFIMYLELGLHVTDISNCAPIIVVTVVSIDQPDSHLRRFPVELFTREQSIPIRLFHPCFLSKNYIIQQKQVTMV